MFRVKAVVAGELVMHEGSVKAFEELRGVFAAPARAVLEDADVRAPGIQRARGVEPHVGPLLLPPGTLGALPVDLHGRLVGVEHGRGDEAFLHVSDEREEVVLGIRASTMRAPAGRTGRRARISGRGRWPQVPAWRRSAGGGTEERERS